VWFTVLWLWFLRNTSPSLLLMCSVHLFHICMILHGLLLHLT
jgi:hypothetical protein